MASFVVHMQCLTAHTHGSEPGSDPDDGYHYVQSPLDVVFICFMIKTIDIYYISFMCA